MSNFMSSGGFALAGGIAADDAMNSKKMKMLFMLLLACVVYSDFYAAPRALGHCGAISASE